MKKFIRIMLGDFKQEKFEKLEVIVFSIIVPMIFIVLCILADTIIYYNQK